MTLNSATTPSEILHLASLFLGACETFLPPIILWETQEDGIYFTTKPLSAKRRPVAAIILIHPEVDEKTDRLKWELALGVKRGWQTKPNLAGTPYIGWQSSRRLENPEDFPEALREILDWLLP